MINIIQELLKNEDYNLKDINGRLILFQDKLNCFPEDYIEIEKNELTGEFSVYEVHRVEKQNRLETKREDEAAICAVIFVKKMYDDIVNRVRIRRIRSYINSGENRKALNCSIEGFDDSIYSIGCEDSMKISLIQVEDKVNIKFGGKYLAKNVSIGRGYVILYNYCEELQYISSFYNKIENKLKCSVDREKIIKWYIL